MNAARFGRELALALVISIAAAVGYELSRRWLGSSQALKLNLLLASSAYFVVWLSWAGKRSGRLVAISLWLVMGAGLLVLNPGLSAWLLLPSILIWLARLWFRSAGPLAALADAALCSFALAAAIVSADHSHSLFLALWCYFLIQALNPFLPGTSPAAPRAHSDPFDAAARQAEAALRRLSVGR
ncbi:MAG: hypothetical protein KDI71_10775 [Xanthomonadales bacterium]|nr:hypothetical protein [Xanthomonadales bacterium]